MSLYRPTPRPGGYLKIKLNVKEKKNRKLQFNQYQNISSMVEDMEKEKYKVEKTVVKNPPAPTITPINSLNLPKISQESLFDKFLIENEYNGTLIIYNYMYTFSYYSVASIEHFIKGANFIHMFTFIYFPNIIKIINNKHIKKRPWGGGIRLIPEITHVIIGIIHY